MIIFVGFDLQDISKMCKQPSYVLLCIWRVHSESSSTVLLAELKRRTNYILAASSGTKTTLGSLISVGVHVQISWRKWFQGSRQSLPFAVPMDWREQNDHIRECYFCLTNVKCFSTKSKYVVQYLNLPSTIKPIPHDGFPILKLPADKFEESFIRKRAWN